MSVFLNILIGLLLLSFVVFIHELGHFIAAKSCGVEVLTFSIGFGPVLLKKKIGGTEYRLSLLPLGGYCGMKGEQAFSEAVEKNLPSIPKEEGGFYGVSKLKRIIIAFAGPFANYFLAIVCLAIVSSIGTTYYTSTNKIAPLYYYNKTDNSPAKTSDLRMGDVILEIDGNKVNNFSDILEIVAVNPQTELNFLIERDGEVINKKITPSLNKKTGAGYIGFYPFDDLKLAEIKNGSIADKAGLQSGDVITHVNDTAVFNIYDLNYYFMSNQDLKAAEFTVLRSGQTKKLMVDVPVLSNGFYDFGLVIERMKVTIPGTGFFASIGAGFTKTHELFGLVLKSLGLLFKGVDLKSAVSGPLLISNILGETAKIGFSESFLRGISNISNFIGIICISLFIMNLLPLPVLDGGVIFVALIEMISRKAIRPKVLYYMHIVGTVLILLLSALVIWNDVGNIIKLF